MKQNSKLKTQQKNKQSINSKAKMISIKVLALFSVVCLLELARAQNCGVSQVSPNIPAYYNSKRIIGGQDANANSWPWTVSIRYYDGVYVYDHYCTGTLIAADTVLTAASCVYGKNPSNLIILVGMHARNSISLSNVAFVRSYAYNGAYNGNSLTKGNDIALIKLRSPVALSNKVQIACLPKTSSDYTSLINKKLVTVGWGSTNGVNSNAYYSAYLKQTALTLLNSNNAACTTISYNQNNLFCAKDLIYSSNICFADGGAPLMAQIGGRWYVYGVVSFLISNNNVCVNAKPSYYTSVPYFLTWINTWSPRI